MARTQTQKPLETKVEPGIPEGHALITAEEKRHDELVDAVTAGHADAIYQAGLFQGHQMHGKIAAVAGVLIFERMRESKNYKGLPYNDPENPRRRRVICTLEEYCLHYLGVGYESLREQAQRKAELGAQAYESMSALGVTRQQLREISGLPEDAQEVVKQAAKEKDRDRLFELLEAYAVQNAKAREQREQQIAKEREEGRKDKEVHERRVAALHQEKESLAEKLDRRDSDSPAARELALWSELMDRLKACGLPLHELEKTLQAITELEAAENISESLDVARCHTLVFLGQTLLEIGARQGIRVNLQEVVDPPWLRNPPGAGPQDDKPLN